MAAVIELYCVWGKQIDLAAGLKIISETAEVSIGNAFCIDNWKWENQQAILDFSEIEEKIEKNKIVVIDLKLSVFKSAGIYIEKMQNDYVYEMWIDTEGFPELDVDVITKANQKFYQRAYKALETIVERQKIPFKILGIGVETNFEYDEDVNEIVRKSGHMVSWVSNKTLEKKTPLSGGKIKKEGETI